MLHINKAACLVLLQQTLVVLELKWRGRPGVRLCNFPTGVIVVIVIGGLGCARL